LFILRCTRRLYERIEPWAAPEREPPTASTTRLGDWAATIVVVRREHLVLAVSLVTLLPVVIPVAPATTVLARLPAALGHALRALGIGRHRIATEVAAMAGCTVTGLGDRQVQSSLADLAGLLDTYVDGAPLGEVALRMAGAPCKHLDGARPRDEAVRVLSARHLHLVRT
jgi:hypothetical protein